MSELQVRVLTDARRRVAARWIQHNGRDGYGGVCAGQALVDGWMSQVDVEPDLGDENYHQVIQVFVQAILSSHDSASYGGSIPAWNDMPLRTRGEVLDVFDRAIQIASTSTSTRRTGRGSAEAIWMVGFSSPMTVLNISMPKPTPIQALSTKAKELVDA